MANQLHVFNFNNRSLSPTQSDGSISIISLEDLEAGRYSPTLMSNDNEYASDDTLDSMENGKSRVNEVNSKYLRALLKIPEKKQTEITSSENIQSRKLSLIQPVTFEEQVTELKNVLSGYTRDVVLTAFESLNLTPKINKQQYSVDNSELHAPLKSTWNKSYWGNNSFESDFEEEVSF